MRPGGSISTHSMRCCSCGVVLLTIKPDDLGGANHVGESQRGNSRGYEGKRGSRDAVLQTEKSDG